MGRADRPAAWITLDGSSTRAPPFTHHGPHQSDRPSSFRPCPRRWCPPSAPSSPPRPLAPLSQVPRSSRPLRAPTLPSDDTAMTRGAAMLQFSAHAEKPSTPTHIPGGGLDKLPFFPAPSSRSREDRAPVQLAVGRVYRRPQPATRPCPCPRTGSRGTQVRVACGKLQARYIQ